MHRLAVLVAMIGFLASTAFAQKAPLSAVTLRVEGKHLQYEYDLSSMFDPQLWSVLEKNQDNHIIIEVRLRDSANRIRVRQYHRLQLVVLKGDRVRVTSDGVRTKTYPTRGHLLQALRRVPGKPILADQFSGERGFLEIVAMVNPYAVYSFPQGDESVASGRVVPRTYFDRKLHLRSTPISALR
jgi:hypothetical protein